MIIQVRDILQMICEMSKSEFCYLLKVVGDNHSIISFFGNIEIPGDNISELNRKLSSSSFFDIKSSKRTDLVDFMPELNSVNSLFVEPLNNNADSQIFLITLSSNQGISKIVNESSIRIVKTYLTQILHKAELSNKINHEEIFSEITDNIDSVLYSTNADGAEYYFISGSVKKLFGYSPEEIYNKRSSLIESVSEEHRQDFKKFVHRLQSGKASKVEYTIKDKSNNERWVSHSGVPIIDNSNIVRIVGLIKVITEEKQLLSKLEKSEEKFRQLIETASDLIFNLDGHGYFLMVNRNGASALGYEPEEMIGKHFLEFVDEQHKSEIAVAFQKILLSDSTIAFEARFMNKFCKNIIFEIQAKPTKSEDEINGLLAIGRDITDRVQNEHKLKELNSKLIEANRIISIERNRAKNQISDLEELNELKNNFISNISHELRTPLASVVGFAETIASDPSLSKSTILEFNDIILSEGLRLSKLINDVLDFSKLESQQEALDMEDFNIITVINQSVEIFSPYAKEKDLTLTSDLPRDEIMIYGDKEKINKAFSNILSNAIKFTDNGGRVTVMAQDFEKEVEFLISDTGIGIPDKDVPGLFQKFSKVHKSGDYVRGAGLGLVTAKQIIDLHKGLIRVNSEVEKGTTFVVRLPKKKIKEEV